MTFLKQSTVILLKEEYQTSIEKRNHYTLAQKAIDNNGSNITSSEQQLEEWAKFLEAKAKFSPRDDEPAVNLSDPTDIDVTVRDITIVEVQECVRKLKHGKAAGQDTIPVEQYKSSETAASELRSVLLSIWTDESIPDELTWRHADALQEEMSEQADKLQSLRSAESQLQSVCNDFADANASILRDKNISYPSWFSKRSRL